MCEFEFHQNAWHHKVFREEILYIFISKLLLVHLCISAAVDVASKAAEDIFSFSIMKTPLQISISWQLCRLCFYVILCSK